MSLPPGLKLSHYQLLEKIGAGGMGVVYRAEDTRLRRPVALKLLEEFSQKEARARFLQEARTAAALNHPSICTIYEVGEVQPEDARSLPLEDVRIQAGMPYIAMELIEGETLHKILSRSGPPPLERILDIAIAVADGLAEAHARQVVHRDLKPHNIMVTAQGRVKIVDFGLAQPAPAPASEIHDADTVSGIQTAPFQIAGTVFYMSPEQAAGRVVDARSDLFSFGAVLYEMASGQKPFAGDTAISIIAKILESEPAPMDPAAPLHSEELHHVVGRCLRKQPEDRFGDTMELVLALKDVRQSLRHRAQAVTIDSQGALSPTTIAVFPFAVRGGDEFAYLGEGIVDLLSTKLDGAGALRSVDAHVILGQGSRKTTASSPDQARSIARRYGADLFVLGNILEVSGQLSIDASLYETRSGSESVAKATVQGQASGIFDLLDDLTAKLLTSRFGQPAGRLQQMGTLTTESFPALKAYLRGESEMRSVRRAPAVECFREAVAADPGFALAWYRLSVAALWSGQAAVALDSVQRAMEHSRRLSERDRQLLQAFQAVLSGANDEAQQLYTTIVGQHPDDVEAWYQLGELLFHYGPQRGHSLSESRDAWERVLFLDPGHTNALVHLAVIAASVGNRAELASSIQRTLQLSPGADSAPGLQALRAFALGDTKQQRMVVEDLRKTSDSGVTWAIRFVGSYMGDLQAAHRLAGLLTEPVRATETRVSGHVIRAYLQLARGLNSSASQELDVATGLDPIAVTEHRALLSVLPFLEVSPRSEDILSRVRQSEVGARPENIPSDPGLTTHAEIHPQLRAYLAGLLSLRLGQTEAALQFATMLDSLPGPSAAAILFKDLSQSVRAHVAWAQGKHEKALALLEEGRMEPRFDQTYSSPFFSQALERYSRGEWLFHQGRLQEALTWFGTFAQNSLYDLIYVAPSHYRRGEIYERLDDPCTAAEHYAAFVELWKECDPERRPLLDSARARLQELHCET